MKKALGTILVLLVVVAVAAWYFVTQRMDGMIAAKIESAASATFGTQVSVGAVQTDIKNGSLTISDITVANPPGYENTNAFSLQGIEAAVDYENFDIKRLIVDNPEIIIEEKAGETNFSEMLAALEKREAQPSGADTAEPVIFIRHFRMNKSRAAFESKSMDRYTDIEIDAVELRDVRGTPGEVAAVIASEVVNEVVSEAAKEMLKAKASEKINDLLGRDRD
jgi:flagellar basal body-associated protein FliL